MGALLAVLAGLGTYLLLTARRTGTRPHPGRDARRSLTAWMTEAGLDDVGPLRLASVSAGLAALVATMAFAIFGGALPALVGGCLAATVPATSIRHRRSARRAAAQESWPRMIDEIRILTSAAGRSVPQALFDVGDRAPHEMSDAFDAARREWMLTTDFERTLAVLAASLADPTADAACETLLVAHVLGGRELDARLEALAADRRLDLDGRKDARSRQAGVRFARLFVLIVPLGMAAAGMAVGDGRAAFGEPVGQVAVVVALVIIGACWAWASRLMALPEEERVFGS